MIERILLVDDDESVIRALSRHISRLYEVHVAFNGAMALEQMKQHSFAVVVSDIRMPGMSGIEFIEQAKSTWPDTQYLLLTGNQETEEDEYSPERLPSVRKVLRKPCSMRDLLAAIGQASLAYADATASNDGSTPQVHQLTENC